MDIVSAHPFILELFVTHQGDDHDISKVLTDLESFLVRRMICGLNTRGYNRLFVDMLGALEGDGSVSERLRQFLLSSTAASNRWPDDKEFEEAWISKPIYEILVQRRIQMLLHALNLEMRNKMTEEIKYKKLQIEHLLPRSWQKHYPLPSGIEAQVAIERRNSVLNTVGNLTLITPPLNNYNSNDLWARKPKNILKHSALNLNRNLETFGEWSEDAIRNRSIALFETAKQIWPHPGASMNRIKISEP